MKMLSMALITCFCLPLMANADECPTPEKIQGLSGKITSILKYNDASYSKMGTYGCVSIDGKAGVIGAGDYPVVDNYKAVLQQANTAVSRVNGAYTINGKPGLCAYSFPGSMSNNCGAQGGYCVMFMQVNCQDFANAHH